MCERAGGRRTQASSTPLSLFLSSPLSPDPRLALFVSTLFVNVLLPSSSTFSLPPGTPLPQQTTVTITESSVCFAWSHALLLDHVTCPYELSVPTLLRPHATSLARSLAGSLSLSLSFSLPPVYSPVGLHLEHVQQHRAALRVRPLVRHVRALVVRACDVLARISRPQRRRTFSA
jgi:hypothetical protein